MMDNAAQFRAEELGEGWRGWWDQVDTRGDERGGRQMSVGRGVGIVGRPPHASPHASNFHHTHRPKGLKTVTPQRKQRTLNE